jgi:hypothetical protein
LQKSPSECKLLNGDADVIGNSLQRVAQGRELAARQLSCPK